MRTMYTLIAIAIAAILPIGFLTFTYQSDLGSHSYEFERKLVKPIRAMKRIDLEQTKSYIAGFSDKSIYIGNYYSTGLLLSIDSKLDTLHQLKVNLKNSRLIDNKGQYRTHISENRFYLANGLARSIFSGYMDSLTAFPNPIDIPYFQIFEPISSDMFAFRYVSSNTNSNALRIETTGGKRIDNEQILEKQVDGLFCTSGMLHYNPKIQKLIYLYYYRNEILILDTNLNSVKKMRSIDPIDTARFTVETIKSNNTTVKTSPAVLVNAKSSTWGKHLFVQSKIMGKHEDMVAFEDAAVIDVYDLESQTYQFSFYVSNQDKTPISEMAVFDGNLYTISSHYLNQYILSFN